MVFAFTLPMELKLTPLEDFSISNAEVLISVSVVHESSMEPVDLLTEKAVNFSGSAAVTVMLPK